MIEVVDAGRWTTVQDRGRPGLERFGIPPGGAADWFAAAVANRIVGNREDAALLECTAAGPTLRFEAAAIVPTVRLAPRAIRISCQLAAPEE